MTFSKVIVCLSIAFASSFASADFNDQQEQTVPAAQELSQDDAINAQPFMELMVKSTQATLAAGRCTGSYDCSWPTTQCVNNRCVKSNGDGAECSGSYDCSWPTNECRNGRCVKSNGDGGECTGSYDCSWPYSSCKNGNCERP